MGERKIRIRSGEKGDVGAETVKHFKLTRLYVLESLFFSLIPLITNA